MIPEDATHVWTCAVSRPWIGPLFRRAFYKRDGDKWLSYSVSNMWLPSSNDKDWFDTEREAGYFVTREVFESPDFIEKPEKVS